MYIYEHPPNYSNEIHQFELVRIINIHRISPDSNAFTSHLSLVLWNMNGQDLFFIFLLLILWSKHTQDDKPLQLPTENTGGAANGTTASRAGATSNPNP